MCKAVREMCVSSATSWESNSVPQVGGLSQGRACELCLGKGTHSSIMRIYSFHTSNGNEPKCLYVKRFALRGRVAHVSARRRTDMREALCAMRARHARVRPGPHRYAGSAIFRAMRTSLHVFFLPCTYVRKTLRATRARHARVHPPRTDVRDSVSRHAGETRTCPAAHIRAGSASRYAGEMLTCPPGAAQTCGKRSALCGRDTHVSTLIRSYVRDSASRYAGETRTCPPFPAQICAKISALCGRDTHVSASPCPSRS